MLMLAAAFFVGEERLIQVGENGSLFQRLEGIVGRHPRLHGDGGDGQTAAFALLVKRRRCLIHKVFSPFLCQVGKAEVIKIR